MRKHTIKAYLPGEQSAYLSNGFIGLRMRENPLRDQTALLSGFSMMQEEHAVEALAPVPAIRYDILLEGTSLSARPDLYTMGKQVYDFATGELATFFTFSSVDGHLLSGVHIIFPSRADPTLVIQCLRLATESDTEVRVETSFSLEGLPLTQKLRVVPRVDADGVFLMESRGGIDRAGAAFQSFRDEGRHMQGTEDTWGYENERIAKSYLITLQKDRPATLTTVTAYVPLSLHAEPHWQAVRMIKLASWKGISRLRSDHLEKWQDIWQHRVVIDGATEHEQDMADAAMFYLMSSMHSSCPFSIAPFGLSDRNKYKGHVFWDTESFMFLLPLLTSAPIARAMLEYRFDRLPAAKNNARINGYLGAQFPWQSFMSGDEVTRVSAGQAGGAGEQHVNMDVALGFAAYARMNPGDDVFLKERAWPVLREVAEWIESRVAQTERGYEILFVTGINEEQDNVNNDAYTNLLCRQVLCFALETAEKLGYHPRASWKRIAENLYMPIRNGILLEHDAAAPEHQTMAPMMAYFPYGCSLGEEVDRRTLQHYVDNCSDEQLTYPMLSGFLSVFPAIAGDRLKARDFFLKGNADFLTSPYLMPVEFSTRSERFLKSPELAKTTFLTGRGSMMAALMLGFTRFNFWKKDPAAWMEGPIVLPEGWKQITLSRIYVDGRPARLTAGQGEQKARLEWLEEI